MVGFVAPARGTAPPAWGTRDWAKVYWERLTGRKLPKTARFGGQAGKVKNT